MEHTRKEVLLKMKEIFEKNDTTFFLSCGTCLGIYRDHNIIDWDFDVDIGILEKDLQNLPLIIAEISIFLGEKPKVFHVNGGRAALFNWGYCEGQTPSSLDIAIYFLDRDRDVYWKIIEVGTGYWIAEFRTRLFDSFQKVVFNDLVFNLPNPTEEYLLASYGENWKVQSQETWPHEKHPNIVKYVER